MEIIYLISIVISIITLIQYFVLCANVKRIKTILESPSATTNVHLSQYRKHRFWGNDVQAIEELQDAFWYDLEQLKSMNPGQEEASKKYAELVNKYGSAFDKYGITAPVWDGRSPY